MKPLRIAIPAALLLAMGVGTWFLAKRPGLRPQEESAAPMYRIQADGPWKVIEYAEDLVPIRAITWIQGRPSGSLFAQVLTQNDRQQLSVFDQGASLATITVPRPQVVDEGFFRFAELRDAVLFAGRKALLMYGPGNGRNDEGSLLVLIDLDSPGSPWAERIQADRIAFEPSLDPDWVYAYGSPSRLHRFHLPAAGKSGAPKVESIDLPAEIEAPSSLLPTGHGAFLLAHSKGVSAFQGSKGWLHHPAPGRPLLAGNAATPRLAAAGGAFWWQPFPGQLFEVTQDGTTKAEATPGAPLAGGDLALDSNLLALLGADPSGDLWFGLGAPLLPNPVPPKEAPIEPAKAPTPGMEPPPPEPAGPEPELLPVDRERWEAHLKGGLSRIYRWTPGKPVLRLYRWSNPDWAKSRPGGFQLPEGPGNLHPGSGGFLLGGERRVAWTPLATLGPGVDPVQPK